MPCPPNKRVIGRRPQVAIEFVASASKRTPVNLTNHSYFNLAGVAAGDILSHEMEIPSQFYIPVNDDSIPTGEVALVQVFPFCHSCRGARLSDRGPVSGHAL